MKPAVLGAGLVVLLAISPSAATVRRPAVAGGFYPGDPATLNRAVRGYLAGAKPASRPAVAVIVPHAGYEYSGAVAGQGFAALAGVRAERVILLGPSHHSGFAGGALPAADVTAFAIPGGAVPVDLAALSRLRRCPGFDGPAAAHDPEHSLEVELPFLVRVAPGARVVPVLVGFQTSRDEEAAMARCLARLLTPRTVVVTSSDFTHHGAAYRWTPFAASPDLGERLLGLGRATAGRAAAIDPRGFEEQVGVSGDTVCGARPIAVLLQLLAHAFTGKGSVAAVTTSGRVTGDWRRSVTYAAVRYTGTWTAWRDDPPRPVLGSLNSGQRKAVLELARAALASHLGHGPELAEWYAAHRVGGSLLARAGAFVTLRRPAAARGEVGPLRACMGVIEPRKPLADAVVSSAVSAAHDPRFPQMRRAELDGLVLEVSVLSPPRRVAGPQSVVLGRDGVVLSKSGRSAVFLPQVATETGWSRDEFLTHLAQKAGLPGNAWRSGCSLETFTAQVFGEER